MHPAPSLILFTVFSGLGLGLIVWLGLGSGPDGGPFGPVACLAALGSAAAGGAFSTLHLANPKNAWRAFSQWRSSWLSREACLMVAALVVFALYAGVWAATGERWRGLGFSAAALAVATVHATAMIYAQLKTVPAWSATPTPALFLGLSLAGGLLACRALQGVFGESDGLWHAVPALLAAGGLCVWWTARAAGAGRTATGSSVASATGLGRRVRSFEAPHTGRNYLLDEMAFRIGRKRAFALRLIGAAAGFVVPLSLCGLALVVSGWVLLPALVCHVAGVMALRWLFFAEAQHVQALYYGEG